MTFEEAQLRLLEEWKKAQVEAATAAAEYESDGNYWHHFCEKRMAEAVLRALEALPPPPHEEMVEVVKNTMISKGCGDGSAKILAKAAIAALSPWLNRSNSTPLDPDMPVDQLRLHMGELTASEIRVARAAIRWANS